MSRKRNNRRRSFERVNYKRSFPKDRFFTALIYVLVVYWILILIFLIGVIANLPIFHQVFCSNAIC